MCRRATTLLLLAMLTVAAVACGDDGDGAAGTTVGTTTAPAREEPPDEPPDEPADEPTAAEGPEEPVEFARGTATVEITGSDEDEQSWELELDTELENILDPEGGDLELRWTDDSDNALKVGVTYTGVEVGVVDAFVRVEVGGFRRPYVDPVHTLCRVEVLELAADSLDGTLECEGLVGFSDETDQQTLDVEATFSAGSGTPTDGV
jgi:hypothetical protein